GEDEREEGSGESGHGEQVGTGRGKRVRAGRRAEKSARERAGWRERGKRRIRETRWKGHPLAPALQAREPCEPRSQLAQAPAQ
ncbi:unnamed protein product, partial [Ixodes pacificus]